MSDLFYDHLLELDTVDRTIKKVATTRDEAIELWGVVDEIVHHRVLGCVLEHLPKKHHQEFLELFHKSPHDEKLLDYLKQKTKKDIVLVIKEAVAVLVLELTTDLDIGKIK